MISSTQKIIEGLLYVSNNNIVRECLEISHIIDKDRNWEAKEHPELFFLDSFKTPYFLVIVDKQLHVYIIGDLNKGKSYNIIKIEGFEANHLVISKGKLLDIIQREARETKKLFLPIGFGQRIIFIKPNYKNNTFSEDNIFIFNRQSLKGTIMTKSTWSLGSDIYSVSQPEYTTRGVEIIRAIFEEF